MSYLRHISCVVLLALLAMTPAASSPPAAAPPTDPTASTQPTVRLRKLHLVRPDLIPYPIAYEIYC